MSALSPDFERGVAPLFDLSGKVALVTGGSGIGRAAALLLAAAGACVVLADMPDRIAPPETAGIETVRLDVTSEASIDDAVATIVARYGGIDILVNAAVLHHNHPILETSLAEWDAVQAVNLRSGFLMTRAVVPSMRARGGGRIINVTTMGGVHPVLHGNGAYCASRAGLNQFTKNCALDFAADHITANAILPGAIMTDSIAPAFRPTGPGADPARHIGGFGQPGDVAGMVLLLASPAGRFISGQCIAIDGGFLLS